MQYAINHYQTETRRLYQVLEDRLAHQESCGQGLWLVGGKLSVADLANFGWVSWAGRAGVYDFVRDGVKFDHVRRWLDVMRTRPGVQTGLNEGCDEAYVKMHSNWVMQGQSEEEAKHA